MILSIILFVVLGLAKHQASGAGIIFLMAFIGLAIFDRFFESKKPDFIPQETKPINIKSIILFVIAFSVSLLIEIYLGPFVIRVITQYFTLNVSWLRGLKIAVVIGFFGPFIYYLMKKWPIE